MTSDLFVDGEFISHSGLLLPFKIDLDALTDGDLATLARRVASRRRFSEVYGIPRGGERFAEALRRYRSTDGGLMVVDDVLTTGASMNVKQGNNQGIVIFARGPCPAWVTPLFVENTRL